MTTVVIAAIFGWAMGVLGMGGYLKTLDRNSEFEENPLRHIPFMWIFY